MPQRSWSKKRERQYEHIKALEEAGRAQDRLHAAQALVAQGLATILPSASGTSLASARKMFL